MKLGNPEGLKEVHDISNLAVFGIVVVSLITSIAGEQLTGPLGAFMLEIFPTKIRYTKYGICAKYGKWIYWWSNDFCNGINQKYDYRFGCYVALYWISLSIDINLYCDFSELLYNSRNVQNRFNRR